METVFLFSYELDNSYNNSMIILMLDNPYDNSMIILVNQYLKSSYKFITPFI